MISLIPLFHNTISRSNPLFIYELNALISMISDLIEKHNNISLKFNRSEQSLFFNVVYMINQVHDEI